MIQAVMYFVLGVLTTGLIALAITPAIWRRAIRLTRARVESGIPMTLAEIQAEKDQLRADFAIANRRLELSLSEHEERSAGHAIVVNRQRAEIARLTNDDAAKAETIRTIEQRVADLGRAIEASEARIAAVTADLAARDATLAERGTRIAELDAGLAAAIQLSDEQKVELVARDTTIGNLRDQLTDTRTSETGLGEAKRNLEVALAAEQAALAAERQRTEGLEARIVAFDMERIDRLAALERRAGEVKALETEMVAEGLRRDSLAADLARLVAERDDRLGELARKTEEMAGLRAAAAEATVQRRRAEEQLATAEAALAEAGVELAELRARTSDDAVANGDNMRKAIAATEAEKTALQARLDALQREQAALREENAELRRVGSAEWERIAADNVSLRTLLADLASNVVRLVQPQSAPQAPTPVRAENGNGRREELRKPAPPPPAENGNGHREESRKPAAPPPAESGNGHREEPRKPALPSPAAVMERSEAPVAPPSAVPPRSGDGRSLAERIRALQQGAARH